MISSQQRAGLLTAICRTGFDSKPSMAKVFLAIFGVQSILPLNVAATAHLAPEPDFGRERLRRALTSWHPPLPHDPRLELVQRFSCPHNSSAPEFSLNSGHIVV